MLYNRVSHTSRNPKKSSRTIIDSNVALGLVCSVSREMNSLFSLPVFITLTDRFIETVINSYCVVYKFVRPGNDFIDNLFPTVVFGLLFCVLSVAVILYAAETPIAKVRLL